MRNMIEVNHKAFYNLIEQFTQRQALSVEEGRRYISTNDQEKEWIKITDITDILYVTPSLRLVQIQFKGNIYCAVIGSDLDTSLFDNSIIEETSLNAGVYTLLISLNYVKLDKKVNYLEFYDSILFQHKDKSYKGHDYNDLVPFLEQVYFFVIPDFSIIKIHKLSRTACYIFTKNPLQLVLEFSENVLDTISELSLVGSDNISYKLLLGCLFSTTYKHAFLELYRLIERLFPINYLKDFYKKSGSKLTFLEFSAELENTTNWRPKEDDAIEKIFDSARLNTRTHFEAFHNSSTALQGFNNSKYFYSLRNSIVHFRANHLEQELNNTQWNLLLLATVIMLDEQYSQYSIILSE